MHMTKNLFEAPNQYSFWSASLLVVTVFFIADILTGGLVRESFAMRSNEYGLIFATVIASVGVYASDGSFRRKFARSYSRHKL